MKKSVIYFLIMGSIVLSLELLLYFTPFIFSNLTERVKLMSAMFNYRSDTEILFLGSSRFKDGISPSVVMDNINDSLKTDWKGFNGAITGADIYQLDYFFKRAIHKKGLKILVIEMSLPQLNADIPPHTIHQPPTDLEGNIQQVLSENLRLARWRKSFRLENLKNIPAILAADQLDGSELYRTNILGDFISNDSFKIDGELKRQWKPTVIRPVLISDEGSHEALKIFDNIAKTSRQAGVDILFVVPPLVNSSNMNETTQDILTLYQQIAYKTGTPIVNFSGLDLSENLFRDQDSHLNKEGRFVFSTMLSTVIISSIQNEINK